LARQSLQAQSCAGAPNHGRNQRKRLVQLHGQKPSSIDYYPERGGIPGWGNSLLVTSLKTGALYVLKLNGAGPGIRDVQKVFTTVNRYRDLALSPDHMTIYVATDESGYTRDTQGGATNKLVNPGSILAFTYRPQAAEAGSQ
jgi:glucose/sorbosone dehydrogenase